MALVKAVIDRDNEEAVITRLETKITNHTITPLTMSMVKVMLQQADNGVVRLREIHTRISHLAPPDIADHQAIYEALDDRITLVIVELQDIKSALAPAATGSVPRSEAQQRVKLPDLQLQSFDGKFEDWPSFEDLFLATIDRNVNLAPAQKLQYLKSFTKGEPHALIKAFTITDAHYAEAWKLLQTKYKNNREIIQSLVKRLLYQPKCKGSGATELQALLNTTTECIRSLSVLGCATSTWDDILNVIIIDKLDPEAKSEWAKTLTGTNLPSFAELTAFLESHVRALTARGSVSAPPPRPPPQHQNIFRQGKTARVHHAAPSPKGCPLCSLQHGLSYCPQFVSASLQERQQHVNKLTACSNCLSTAHLWKECNSRYTCRKCQRRHHTLLHRDDNDKPSFHAQNHKSQQHDGGPPGGSTVTSTNHSSISSKEQSLVLLKTAIVFIKDKDGNKQRCRAFLDDGSESSLITESCAAALSLDRQPTDVQIIGVGSTEAAHARWKVSFRIESTLSNAYADVEALILPQVTKNLPRIKCRSTWDHLKYLQLADPEFYQPSKIDLLLSADAVASIMRPGLRRGPPCSPTATRTSFGWVLSGRVATQQQQIVRSYHTSIRLDEIAQHIWKESQPPRATTFTLEERAVESHFASTVTRLEGGRYQVRLPFHSSPDKPNILNIGATRGLAESRLLALERRFQKHPFHHEEYRKFMKEYLELGHMTQVTTSTSTKATYIPHHFVLKEDSSTTKLRVVFDGSMKSTNGISLNSTMMVGPTIQDDLFSILLRFRMNPIAIKGDIAKMYRQFLIHPDDQDHQRILWRDNSSQAIQEYCLSTVTYGTASAPFLATRCLQQLAKDEQSRFPEAAAVLLSSMYVDDLLGGAKDNPTAIELIKQLIKIVATSGMSIRKFCSNSNDVMASIPDDLKEDVSSLSFDHDDYVKALGIVWQPKSDTFTFHTNSKPFAATKRILLSEIAKVFDPLGWLSHLTITAKILFQSSWKQQQDWDDELSPTQQQDWSEYQQQLSTLSKLAIPRFIPHDDKELYLVGFSDASEKAYAACLYLTNGLTANLIAARTKVAPLKQMSIPRLELCAALLLCELLESTTQALDRSYKVTCYTDSMITLKWICSTSRRWKTFVANRVAAIQEVVPPEQWSHVSGVDNPADLPSRGIPANQLINSSLWWNGPSWLNGQPRISPEVDEVADMNIVMSEERTTSTQSHHASVEDFWIITYVKKFSSLKKLITTTAILQKFISYICLAKKATCSKFVSPANRVSAMKSLVRATQAIYFKDDIAQLNKDKTVKSNSKLISLAPFLRDGVLHVGGRLEKSALSFGQRHPMILSKRSYLTELIVMDFHLNKLHATIQLTLEGVFLAYWIIGARSFVRLLIRKCIPCRKVQASTMEQQMGQLPIARVTPDRVFRHTGVDYAGPFSIRVSNRRNAALEKYYFAVFVCMATKACHIEPVSSLSTKAFIAAFIRFTSRRGPCSDLYSDCGTNFKGAERLLRDQLNLLENQTQTKLSELGTTFHFNPPAAPHQGGLWEACVKQVKYHIRRVVGTSILHVEQFTTLLAQIEACLNSRPLIPRSPDPNDFEPLTPGHFLVFCPLIAVPEPDISLVKSNRLDQWQRTQQMMQLIWKRWSNEYLITLQQRAKWQRPQSNAEVGDLVLIASDNQPTTHWTLGRIISVLPGVDNLVRKVMVRYV